MDFRVRKIEDKDREFVKKVSKERWNGLVLSPSGQHHIEDEDGFVAERDGNIIGLLTYQTRNNEREITALVSLEEGKGVGTALIEEVKRASKDSKRLWVITTNDNINAIKFYQKRGFKLVKVYPNELDKYRRIKPIPEKGAWNIPLRDLIEFEILLNS